VYGDLLAAEAELWNSGINLLWSHWIFGASSKGVALEWMTSLCVMPQSQKNRCFVMCMRHHM
jgi:hypothetical protein